MIRIKRIGSHALPLPARQTEGAAGFDLSYAGPHVTLYPNERVALDTGFAWQIPTGWVGRVAPRSGLASRSGLDVLAGVIDSDYRGEVKVILINHGAFKAELKSGERIAQMLVQPILTMSRIEEAESLDDTQRGEGGFGSTGVSLAEAAK